MPIALLVTTSAGANTEALVAGVVDLVRQRVGAVAALRKATVVPALPKTRSGKILRNVLRALADAEPYKLPGTIEDASVVGQVADAIDALGYGRGRNKEDSFR